MKQAGRMWRGLNEGEREPYLTLAQSDKERCVVPHRATLR